MKRVFAFLLLSLLFVITPAAVETFVNPVANGADPFVLKDGDTYYLYVTSGGAYGYRVYTSENLVEWTARGYCLRRSDVYTDQSRETGRPGVYNFWAPEVIREGDTYYMIYTAQEHLGIATSDSPLGPFMNADDSFLMPFKTIDGHFYRDDDGKLYLYFVSVSAGSYNGYTVSGGNNIWGGEFDLATRSFVSAPKLLMTWDKRIEGNDHVVEGPEILKHNGKYYLTFSSTGYTNPGYSVHYATSDSPLGPYTRYTGNPILKSDDPKRQDTENAHLYGTAHHCFTVSPDGKELVIVYHAHRSGTAPAGTDNFVEERRICIDRAWFDEQGILHAGSLQDKVPSATEQPLPSGGKLTRTQTFSGAFANLPELPTVYVAWTDGSDQNPGTKASPLKTIYAACKMLPSGGTIFLTQAYNGETYLDIPAVNGPLQICGVFSAVPMHYKFIAVHSDVYFDNIAFMPETANNISVIECNRNNVTMGEGVSCIAQPTRATFPVLVGGVWRYTGSDGAAVYKNFRHASDAALTSDAEYTLTVLGGTWSLVTEQSARDSVLLPGSSANAKMVLGEQATRTPAKVTGVSVKNSAAGPVITFSRVPGAEKYFIYCRTTLIGVSTNTTFMDTAYVPGTATYYAVAAALNGACVGEQSAMAVIRSSGDQNGDGQITLADALLLQKTQLEGKTVKAEDIQAILGYIVR